MRSAGDLVMYLGESNAHVHRHIIEPDGVHEEYGLRQRKVGFRMGENEEKIDFVLIKKEH